MGRATKNYLLLGTMDAQPDSSVFSNGTGLTATQIGYGDSSNKITGAAGLIIVGTPSATAPSTATNGPGTISGISIAPSDGVSSGYTCASFGGGVAKSNLFGAYACQGTAGSVGATIANDAVAFGLQGFDGTNYTTTAASLRALAGSTWTTSNHEAFLSFDTTPNGSITRTVAGRVDSNQTLVMGGAFNSVGTFSAGTLRPHIQTASTAAANAGIAQTMWNNGATGPTGIFAKSRSGTPGTQAVITTGDTIGTISFQGDDGTNFINAADIIATSTGTIGTGQVPGLLSFRTATSAGTITKAFGIDSAQVVVIGSTTSAGLALFSGATVTPKLQVNANDSAITAFSASAAAKSLYFGKSRGAAVGTMTVVTTGDTLGTINFQASDGTNFNAAATIIATVTGTVAGSRTPGQLVFQTGVDAAGSALTTALTIDNAQLCTFAGGIAISDAKDFAVGTGTGTKIGTATTQKLGFYNAAPIAQRSGAAQAAVATTGSALASYGYTTSAQADAIVTLVNELRAWAVSQGFIKGSA